MLLSDQRLPGLGLGEIAHAADYASRLRAKVHKKIRPGNQTAKRNFAIPEAAPFRLFCNFLISKQRARKRFTDPNGISLRRKQVETKSGQSMKANNNRGDRIAVIGSGIAGLSAAWLLSQRHDVTVFERNTHIGGHTNTRTVMMEDGPVAVDTGFIVYNEATYPNLTAMFRHLDVATEASNMSFAFSLDQGRYEYNGTGLRGVFGQAGNIVNLRHWRMLSDIRRFFSTAPDRISSYDDAISLGEFLECEDYSKAFLEDHIMPMASAIWSSPALAMNRFPARSFIAFYKNHGLLKFRNRPQWRTVSGGAQNYVSRIIRSGNFRTMTDFAISSVLRKPNGIEVRDATGHAMQFDQVVLACPADAALGLLEDADQQETSILGKFKYSDNQTVLHTDHRHMPRRRHLWASWNYLCRSSNDDGNANASCTYWMNRLQSLKTANDLLVTLNPIGKIDPERILYRTNYRHPILDTVSMAAQKHLWQLQGSRNTWFCGSYFGYGFHEDALQSGLAVAEQAGGVRRPWNIENESGRIHLEPIWAMEAAE